jgi:uncharacterized membrane protein
MDMSFKNCWDCPIPLGMLLLNYLILAVLLAGGAWMHRSTRYAVQGLGAVTVVLMSMWTAVFTSVVPNWGIRWSESPLTFLSERQTLAALLGLDLLLVMLMGSVYWMRSRRGGHDARSSR